MVCSDDARALGPTGVVLPVVGDERPSGAMPNSDVDLEHLRCWLAHPGLRDTDKMPVWMQVVLPIFTALLAGSTGLWFARLGKTLDRRRERLEAEAAAEAKRARWLAEKLPRFVLTRYAKGMSFEIVKGYSLENMSRYPATGISVTFADYPREKVKGLPDEPFTLGVNCRVWHVWS